MRKRIFQIIDVNGDNKASNMYDLFMIVTIIASIVPLAFKNKFIILDYIDKITTIIFILDYFLRLITADIKLKKRWISFIKYPFTPMAIIDLLSILPSLTALNSGLKILKLIRLLRCLKVVKTFKLIRYSKNISIIINVFKKQKKPLYCVGSFAIAYVLISALVVFNVEPETFNTYFDAVYWATVSLTTMGYGDIYPITIPGKVVTMLSSILGVAIIALPSGIITAGYMEEIHTENNIKEIQDESSYSKS